MNQPQNQDIKDILAFIEAESACIEASGLGLLVTYLETLRETLTEYGRRTIRYDWLTLHQYELAEIEQQEFNAIEPLSDTERLILAAIDALINMHFVSPAVVPDLAYAESLCCYICQALRT